ncbi:MAG: RNA polymerase sigma factor [Acidobacteriia bacterium]|nr:RNA polymerase sigma factor [Terriglobia bacterium]
MAGQAILGETVLKQTSVSAAQTPGVIVESLVAEHTLMVFRIAYSILRNHHDAEDAAQECFLKALKSAQRSKDLLAQVRNTKTWLARVAWTTALDRRSRRAVSGDHEVSAEAAVEASGDDFLGHAALEQIPDSAVAPDEQAAGRQMAQLLEKLIAGLPEDLRQPLELSTVQELNSAEIADVMGIPESSVRTRLMRARRLLKEKFSALLEVKNRA